MEEKERKFGKIAKLEMDNSRTAEEQELRQRIERRKNDAEKEQRRKDREDKRRLRLVQSGFILFEPTKFDIIYRSSKNI